jgi:uncharacterized protein YjcR
MTQENNKNKRGAPLGNQNARTHGFYSQRLSRRQQRILEAASSLNGLDHEIAIVRMKIDDILVNSPENTAILMLAMSVLVKLLKAKQVLAKKDSEGLKQALASVVNDLPARLGIMPVVQADGEITFLNVNDAMGKGDAEKKSVEERGEVQ